MVSCILVGIAVVAVGYGVTVTVAVAVLVAVGDGVMDGSCVGDDVFRGVRV